MSCLLARAARTDAEPESPKVDGQRHERIPVDERIPGPPPMPATDDDFGEEIEITTGQKMLSAMSGSLFTSLLATPLDVVRVRLQSQPSQSTFAAVQRAAATTSQPLKNLPPNLGVTACCREVFFTSSNSDVCLAGPKYPGLAHSGAGSGLGCAVEETQRRTFNSTLDGLQKIARHEGVTTLWRGLSPTLLMALPANIIYFTGYDWLRYDPKSPIRRIASDGYAPLVAAPTARIMAAVVVSPIEMFKTRLQASHSPTGAGHFADALKGLREMVHANGYLSLWRGLGLTLWRDVPFSGLYWWGYETIRGQLTAARERPRGRSLDIDGNRTEARSRSQSRKDLSATFTDSCIAGAGSGAVATFVTMPFDVGKTRQQVFKEGGPNSRPGTLAPEQLSMPKFLLHIYREEGLTGLWKGWIPRILRVAPACAIMISCYEVGKRMARSMNEKAKRKGELGN